MTEFPTPPAIDTGRMNRVLLACALGLSFFQAAAEPQAPGPSAPIETRDPALFQAWRDASAERQARVQGFESFLREHGLVDLVPLDQLLRSASDWARCQAEPYAVPPETQWPQVESTLRLLALLKTSGVLREIELHSAYRDAELNACAGGAARSVHLVGFAIDFHPLNDPEAGERLCRFWREQGEAWKMGLSRYPSGRVHIDTWRFRTWGADHSGQTAFCTAASAMVQPPPSTP